MKIDVAINVYGKPFQTAVALLSLLKYSGSRIGKIYFIKEQRQPGNIDFGFLENLLSDRIVVHTPSYWHSYNVTDPTRLNDPEYRRSLRYQYAWEESDADGLFITHNDVLYFGDIVGRFAAVIGDNAAVGEIGQCWNCPALAAGVCDCDRFADFNPSYEELEELYQKFPSGRTGSEIKIATKEAPWPLPECRVNEWAVLINLNIARPATMPLGSAFPFGAFTLDIGTQWFREMSLNGFRFLNHSIKEFAQHGWTADGRGGHPALFDYGTYEYGEAEALSVLITDFGIDESILARAPGQKWRTRLKAFIRRTRGY